MAKRAPARTTSVFSLGHTKMRATISRRAAAAGVVDDADDAPHVLRRQPVDDRPVGLAPGEPQHALAQRGDEDRRRVLGSHTEAEAADLERVVGRRHLLPRQRVAEEAHDVADLLVRLDERHAVPPLDDDVARRADADGEPPGRGVGQRGDALGEARRRPGERRDDRRAEAQPRLPRRGERQRRERVGAVRLGRPHVGVPEVGELGETVATGVQRTGQRHGHARRTTAHGVIARCLADSSCSVASRSTSADGLPFGLDACRADRQRLPAPGRAAVPRRASASSTSRTSRRRRGAR